MLQRSEYDAAYFEGRADPGGGHPAGYSVYSHISGNVDALTGLTLWEGRAQRLIASAALTGQVVVEFGCAYGYLVAELNAAGVEAYGLDWSAHAIAQAKALHPSISDRFIECDVLDDSAAGLGQFRRNEWDFILTRDVLVCWPLATLAAAIPEWDRVAQRGQVHITKYEADPSAWYYPHSLADLQGLSWPTNSRLVDLREETVTVL